MTKVRKHSRKNSGGRVSGVKKHLRNVGKSKVKSVKNNEPNNTNDNTFTGFNGHEYMPIGNVKNILDKAKDEIFVYVTDPSEQSWHSKFYNNDLTPEQKKDVFYDLDNGYFIFTPPNTVGYCILSDKFMNENFDMNMLRQENPALVSYEKRPTETVKELSSQQRSLENEIFNIDELAYEITKDDDEYHYDSFMKKFENANIDMEKHERQEFLDTINTLSANAEKQLNAKRKELKNVEHKQDYLYKVERIRNSGILDRRMQDRIASQIDVKQIKWIAKKYKEYNKYKKYEEPQHVVSKLNDKDKLQNFINESNIKKENIRIGNYSSFEVSNKNNNPYSNLAGTGVWKKEGGANMWTAETPERKESFGKSNLKWLKLYATDSNKFTFVYDGYDSGFEKAIKFPDKAKDFKAAKTYVANMLPDLVDVKGLFE